MNTEKLCSELLFDYLNFYTVVYFLLYIYYKPGARVKYFNTLLNRTWLHFYDAV